MTMLKVNHIESHYGQVIALHDIDVDVNKGEIVTLLGVNGAGKSTTLKTISGLLHPVKGTIEFEGERIDRMQRENIVRRGIVHVPEGRKIFPGLTVRENLMMGTSNQKLKRYEVEQGIERVLEVFPDLKRLYKQLGWSLRISDRAYLLETGRVIRNDTAENLLKDETVRAALMGAGRLASTGS